MSPVVIRKKSAPLGAVTLFMGHLSRWCGEAPPLTVREPYMVIWEWLRGSVIRNKNLGIYILHAQENQSGAGSYLSVVSI